MFLQENFPGVMKINTNLNRRFEALTGLTTETAEQLQVREESSSLLFIVDNPLSAEC